MSGESPRTPRRGKAALFTAVHAAGVVVASWQARVILEGNVVNDVHAFVPPWVQRLNAERLQE